MVNKIKMDNVALFPAFAKMKEEDQIAYFRNLPSIKTDAQAKKMHANYLKLSGNGSNTRKAKAKSKKNNS